MNVVMLTDEEQMIHAHKGNKAYAEQRKRTRQQLANKVKQLYTERNLTMSEIGEILDLSYYVIRKILTDECGIDPSTFRKQVGRGKLYKKVKSFLIKKEKQELQKEEQES